MSRKLNKDAERFVKNKKVLDQLAKYKSLNVEQTREIISLREQLSIIDKTGKILDFSKPLSIEKDNRLKTDITPIVLLSDGHVEERVTLSSTNNLNEYNPDIAEKRIGKFFTNVLKIVNKERHGATINNIVVGILGDMVSGYIHEELIEDNYMSPTQAILFAEELIIKGLQFLSEHGDFKKIIVVCKMGNHSRLSKRKKYSTGYKNSLEYVMYHNIIKNIKLNNKYNNIEFLLEDNNISYLKIYDLNVRFCHGDHFNYRGGIGGVEIPFKGWLYKQNESIHADLTCVGHWHRHAIIGDGIINSSIKGFDAYAIEHGFRYQSPTQHMQLVDRDRGLITNYKIFLD